MAGDVRRYNSADEDNFTQCGIFFREVLKEDEKERLVDNIASHLCNAQKFLQVSISKAFDMTPPQGKTCELNLAYENLNSNCLLYTSPSPRDLSTSRMPSSA